MHAAALVDSNPSDTHLHALLERSSQQHRAQFGRDATLLAAAPGRVNLIGEHTDYNDGFVFPMGIERYVVMAASNQGGSARSLRVFSHAVRESAEIQLDDEIRPSDPAWANYVRGVAAGFLRRRYPVESLDLSIASSVPLGAGLSSSAALEVATATILETAAGLRLDPLEKAILCQAAEHEFASVPCGLMDQLASVFSRRDHALFIDCRDRSVSYVPFCDQHLGILICNSNVRHSLATSAYGARRSECERAARALGKSSLRDVTLDDIEQNRERLDSTLLARARHVVTENQRVLRFAEALRASDPSNAGQLMYESHASLRDDFQVSCRELDILVELACELGEAGGIHGSRMTGGGFGGCTVSLIRMEAAPAIAERLALGYRAKTAITADVFVTRPTEGLVRSTTL